jgi:hypothetical protein
MQDPDLRRSRRAGGGALIQGCWVHEWSCSNGPYTRHRRDPAIGAQARDHQPGAAFRSHWRKSVTVR